MSKENIYQNRSVSRILEDLKNQDKNRSLREIEDKQRQRQESERVMRELGVTSILEEIRDNGEVVYFRHNAHTRKEFPFGLVRMRYFTKKVDPAIIEYSDQSTRVRLLFDATQEAVINDCGGIDNYLYHPNSIYIEKRGGDIFIGSTKYDRYNKYQEVAETKIESKDQLPELIARTIHTINPCIQLSNPPEKIEWHRQ